MRWEMQNLVENIAAARDARRADSGLRAQKVDKGRMAARHVLHELGSTRAADAQAQRHGLRTHRATLTKVARQRRHESVAWLRDTSAARHSDIRRTRAALGRSHYHLGRTELDRKANAERWLREISADHAAARREWGRVRVIRAAADVGSLTDLPASGAGTHGDSADPPERTPGQGPDADEAALRDRAFEHLASHPDGTTMNELQHSLGISKNAAARVVRSLLNDGKVEKRDNQYFAL